MHDVKVWVIKRTGRDTLQAVWDDPIPGKRKSKSTGTNKRRDAERFAAKLEKELREGQHRGPRPHDVAGVP